jgi:predicted metal-dependent peptidase
MNWTDVVKPKMRDATRLARRTWTKVDRRAFAMKTVLQGRDDSKRAGTVVLVMDTSGSVGGKEQAQWLGALKDMCHATNPKVLWLLEVDAVVKRATDLSNKRDLQEFVHDNSSGKKGLRGGGGTDMRKAYEWMEENGVKSDLTVFLTDGWTPFPDDYGPSKDVVWVVTTSRPVPVAAGRSVRMMPL